MLTWIVVVADKAGPIDAQCCEGWYNFPEEPGTHLYRWRRLSIMWKVHEKYDNCSLLHILAWSLSSVIMGWVVLAKHHLLPSQTYIIICCLPSCVPGLLLLQTRLGQSVHNVVKVGITIHRNQVLIRINGGYPFYERCMTSTTTVLCCIYWLDRSLVLSWAGLFWQSIISYQVKHTVLFAAFHHADLECCCCRQGWANQYESLDLLGIG